jgi:hypothetical protein
VEVVGVEEVMVAGVEVMVAGVEDIVAGVAGVAKEAGEDIILFMIVIQAIIVIIETYDFLF